MQQAHPTNQSDTIHALINAAAVAAFAINPNHEIIYWNQACSELTGKTAEYMLGTNKHWQAFYSAKRPCLADIVLTGDFDRLPNLYKKFGESALSEEGLYAEGWYENLGGKMRFIIFEAVPVYNRQGELVAVMETLQDITDHKVGVGYMDEIVQVVNTACADTKVLPGFIPVCSSCKSIRDAQGNWVGFETYISSRTGAQFTHSVCPGCARKLYPNYFKK